MVRKPDSLTFHELQFSLSRPTTIDGSKKTAKVRDSIQPQAAKFRFTVYCAKWHAGSFTPVTSFRRASVNARISSCLVSRPPTYRYEPAQRVDLEKMIGYIVPSVRNRRASKPHNRSGKLQQGYSGHLWLPNGSAARVRHYNNLCPYVLK
jgi:hypothetical protein